MGHQAQSDGTTPSKRITILVTSTQRRGAEVFGEHLAVGLTTRGWSVDFVALGAAVGSSSTVSAYPLSPSPVGRLDLSVVRQLRTRISTACPDVVLANGSATLQYSIAATRALKARPRVAYASIGEPAFWANTPRRRLTYRASLALVDQVFSVSQPTATQLTERFGVSERRIRVLPTGVPDDLFEVTKEPHTSPLRVLYMGSLSHEKDPLASIEILKELRAQTPAVLRLLGAGPLKAEIESASRAASVEPHVDLVGSVSDIRPHLAWADVLLLTSITEGLPAAILEAAAAGVPSVAFQVGGVAEAIEDGITGRLIRPGDTRGAAAALAAYAHDPTTRLEHGRAARSMAETRFTLDAAITRYDRALTELAQGAAKE